MHVCICRHVKNGEGAQCVSENGKKHFSFDFCLLLTCVKVLFGSEWMKVIFEYLLSADDDNADEMSPLGTY